MTSKNFLVICVLIIFCSCSGQDNKPQISSADKKQGQVNLPVTDTSDLVMNEEKFWSIIDASRNDAKENYEAQILSLKNRLASLDASAIISFDSTFTALLVTSHDWKLWGAAYVINGGCSDDCFHYFRQYLIAHGKEKFYQTLKDPDSCADWIKSEEEENWEGLQYAAMDAYKLKTGMELPKTITPKFELKGKPFDEETVYKQYPKLAGRFM